LIDASAALRDGFTQTTSQKLSSSLMMLLLAVELISQFLCARRSGENKLPCD
jgi:hypothetical protein